ncbi:hypothetical protein DZC30_01495 [Comamonas testosteroni]|uniref:Uncharacterized protein n=1 Tax=Comamonas testosteroni TaxID=285 RepID=A0A373FSG0_COMTE|nr:hypothetical protein [Comamonas testosteroni]RGE47094.1 hypothetical protein DZC30_01495 [Comamonas testosteroni]
MITAPRFKTAVLVIVPVLLTCWSIADAGLRSNLNRLGYELFVGMFFTAYGLLLGIGELTPYLRKWIEISF